MARKPNPHPEAPEGDADAGALAEAGAALNVVSQRSVEIASVYGEGLPYERERVVAGIQGHAAQTAIGMLGMGKGLVLLKENEPHGEFARICTERLGISARSAQQLMQAAVKYLARGVQTKARAPALLALGHSKLLELVTQPDEVIEELADGGTVAGMTLDDIDAMTSRELREALKTERAARAKDNKAKQKVIEGKESKITELEEQLARRADPTEKEANQLSDLGVTGSAAALALRQLAASAGAVLGDPANEATATAARNAVTYVAQLFVGLVNEIGVAVDFEHEVTPIWLEGVKGAAEAHHAKKKR